MGCFWCIPYGIIISASGRRGVRFLLALSALLQDFVKRDRGKNLRHMFVVVLVAVLLFLFDQFRHPSVNVLLNFIRKGRKIFLITADGHERFWFIRFRY